MHYLYRYSGVEQLSHCLFIHLQECYLMTVRHFTSTTWQVFISHNYIIGVCTRTNTEVLVCMCIETRKMELTLPSRTQCTRHFMS